VSGRLWYALGFLLPPVGLAARLTLAGRDPDAARAAGRGVRSMLFTLLAVTVLAAHFTLVLALSCGMAGMEWVLTLL